ncbi:pentapeptide repeat-containing protein [Dyadobacter sp. MSC1_007]|jgi:uncharacterized protein YjbI with pentapeptide repeats|uniref:pentapeptide repeat-containing protein n=1 Tax=Dyadobacter sp. MSC1_007 TaxID=2909264 RepID=UPI00202EA067|nr:pentapeptide repeat-containing protein [Dyadobacter sp. MSC1_007]
METNMIGSKITQARKEINMSQAQLAQQLFISPQAVGKWERGESVPDILTVTRLAEILGVDLNYFSENFQSVGSEMALSDTLNKEASGNSANSSARQVPINLTAVDLQGNDFAGVVLHHGKFKASALRGANFSGADLTGSQFQAIDAREANFDGANLTECNFSATDLTNATFRKSVLTGTTLEMSGQGAKFIDANLMNAQFTKADLRKTIFENCAFDGVDFNRCDLRGLSFDGQTFQGVRFDKSALNDVSFRGATLRNVSFTLPFFGNKQVIHGHENHLLRRRDDGQTHVRRAQRHGCYRSIKRYNYLRVRAVPR